MTDLEKSSAPKTKPLLRETQKERAKRQAAEQRAEAAEAKNATDAAAIADLQAQVAGLLQAAEAARAAAAEFIKSEERAKLDAVAEAREAGYQLGRIAERAGVKASITAADLDNLPEADRKKIIDRAATPRPAPAAPLGGGSTLADLALKFEPQPEPHSAFSLNQLGKGH